MFLPGHYKVSFNIITYEIHILLGHVQRENFKSENILPF